MEKNDFLTLAIETSCDETAVAIVANGRKVLSNVVSTQIEIHKEYGGVVPEIASRHHLDDINKVIEKALEEANVSIKDINLIAVTKGPGLVGALVVGIAAAKALSLATGIPLVAVNHMYGHVSGNFLTYQDLEPPFICLVVSGGHTNIVEMTSYTHCNVLGSTRDDAVGECYDKVARVLGLGYPGGPKIDKLAEEGDPKAIDFKRVYLEKDSYDFSFSGMKTAVLNYVNQQKQKGLQIKEEDLAASFQQAVIDVLVHKAILACKNRDYTKLVLAGGVAANKGLREALKKRCEEENITLYLPQLSYCTDNAAMIGSFAYYKYMADGADDLLIDAYPNLDF